MKKVLFLLGAALFAFSCSDGGDETPAIEFATLTFEDADYTGAENYLGESNWSSLIDTPEYGGDLLYTVDADYNYVSEYAWHDGDNTELASEVIEGTDYSTGEPSTVFWNGGVAISNYYFEVTEDAQADYDRQLSVPVIDSNGKSGCNGSENFAICNNNSYLYFADGVARQIYCLYVAPTSYMMSVAKYGQESNWGDDIPAMTEDDWFKVTATSVNSLGQEVASTDFYLAQGGAMYEEWTKWDLSVLGEVTKIVFTMDSSVSDDYGSLMPSYVAIDNISVVL